MKRTYVLDTNVILYSPGAIFSFGENDVVIPEVVLEELDAFKKDKNDLGANARYASRLLDKLRKEGKLNKGVVLPGGGKLRVEMNHQETLIPMSWDKGKADNRIIQVCKGLKEEGEDVCLITKDIFERIKADTVDIDVEDFYEKVVPENESQYTGRIDLYASSDKIDEFYRNKIIDVKDLLYYCIKRDEYIIPNLYNNQFIILHSLDNPRKTALGKFDGKKVVNLYYKDVCPLGLTTRNVGQKFMLESLCTNSHVAPLVIIKGPAGTAKTLFSLAVGLGKILENNNNEYRRILVCRPNVTMDEDIGFLPGTEEEKISPFMRPIFDNLEILVDSDEKERYKNEKELMDKIRELFDRRIITTEAVAYLRGRSIVKNWVIIDEAQNLTPKQVKAIVTRVGVGTKLILIGDPDQIDQPFLDSRSNGLCYASEKMKGSELCYQVTLKYDECERSPLAYEASKRL
ncbi:PhoH-like ATPase [Clostridium tetanomorphum]|uniref:PhoH family protein n=1 Tax=Clostridium tetanomorphum TaxID=1553 RepID=A0A923J1G0_CLOTT|nr:PhoH family protein [Clostridium tetanomorphum]KAJ51823.1 PhoH family protein [Clostridium tetanomorphum DSM 665]MBC2397705.1 PhoH family protein [Clostridium tetanomorphum]MBP1865059.1 PhoH-like ATPase [Clostridium tetanomorphum]NRS83343.1 PhoH-like ATPase [Clostridium tetanomorphum]NRZ96543.1 PhoH-like ATPase [Clostridium tetanomorphum]